MSRRNSQPVRFTAPNLMLAIPGIAGVMRDVFKPVPEGFYTRGEDRSVVIQCPCGEEHRVKWGELRRTRCLRHFFCGEEVHCAPAPEPDEQVPCDRCEHGGEYQAGGWHGDDWCCEKCLPVREPQPA